MTILGGGMYSTGCSLVLFKTMNYSMILNYENSILYFVGVLGRPTGRRKKLVLGGLFTVL